MKFFKSRGDVQKIIGVKRVGLESGAGLCFESIHQTAESGDIWKISRKGALAGSFKKEIIRFEMFLCLTRSVNSVNQRGPPGNFS